MRFAREGYSRIFGCGIAALLLNLLGFPTLGLVLLGLTLFVAFFFRDPERTTLADDRFLLAPADGRVVTVEENMQKEPFLTTPATRIGIFMSPLDVHVNRVPVTGTVVSVQYQPGKFRPAFAATAAEVNEQNVVTIEDVRGRHLVLVQVAGILARRIVCAVKDGDRVRRGDRYGMIMLGSRVDLYCPAEVKLKVQVGQRVKAGETVIGEYL
ncbi:MAG TPA: phosphatidylserine decarboxylase family protein [Candidatus Binatia bacterium]|jgi:phosphatidylserine decarboxylase|nr:phosphatidylserine decarboxylase family protein [Candidatus Binatia bacterium]